MRIGHEAGDITAIVQHQHLAGEWRWQRDPRAAIPQAHVHRIRIAAQPRDYSRLIYGPRLEIRTEIEKTARGDMSDEEFAPEGVISEAGLARLRSLLPEAAPRIKAGLRPGEILTLFTTRTFVNLVERKLAAPS